jgi:hypothetical protein
MGKKMKRHSWTELFQEKAHTETINTADLCYLDDLLYDLWALGRNIILVWAPREKGIDLLVIPYYAISETIAGHRPPHTDGDRKHPQKRIDSFLEKIVAGPKHVSLDRLQETAKLLNATARHIDLPFTPGDTLPLKTISSLIKRYSITLVEDRAVALFDIVGFSHYAPLEQVTQLNSLSYSVNTAYSKLMDKEIEIRFARTNTGDGFYIWNRDRGIDSNVDLYHFMHLVLAENAVARSRAIKHSAPLLRTCFHVGGHYEFYQSEGLSPTTFSYIVGDVTVELARMIEQAKAGQILIGDFLIPMLDSAAKAMVPIDTVDFIERAQPRLSSLTNLVLGDDDRIEAIKCYLTGDQRTDGRYAVKQYLITDKHGYSRHVFNAKVNINRGKGIPIYLGIQEAELDDFGIVEAD